MKKKDMKSGMLVELRNGSRYYVLKGTSKGNVFINAKDTKLCKPFNDFKPDLTNKKDKRFDIVAIYDTPNCMYFMNDEKYIEVWKRYDNAKDKICTVCFPSNAEKEYVFILPKEFADVQEGTKVYVETKKGQTVGARVSRIYADSVQAIESNELSGVQLPLCKVVGIPA